VTELWRLPATQLASDIAAKRVSPVEVMEAVLAQAERQHARLNLFVLPLFDAARDAARQAEAAVMRGERLGPLHGVPFTVKDNVAMRGLPTGNGTIAVEAPPAAESWAVVDRLVAAGGIPIGKTTLPEFAHKVLTDSLACGVTRNPWNGHPAAPPAAPVPGWRRASRRWRSARMAAAPSAARPVAPAWSD
jgi:aspartyl-tRNA(Asn)/glutamyl-tRNA(Gln) amidotransferase subunit A